MSGGQSMGRGLEKKPVWPHWAVPYGHVKATEMVGRHKGSEKPSNDFKHADGGGGRTQKQ